LPPAVKMGTGIGLLGMAFAVMAVAAAQAAVLGSVSVVWIVAVFVVITLGDLLVYPVFLSAVSALSPPSRASLVMGLTSVFSGMGNLLSSLVAGTMVLTQPAQIAASFQRLSLLGILIGAVIVGAGWWWSRRAAVSVTAR